MRLLLVKCSIFLLFGCSKNEESTSQTTTQDTAPAHISNTKTYYFGMIRAGSERSQSNEEAAEVQKAHLANIRRLADEGLMALAGPFWNADNTNDIRGIFVYDVDSIEHADMLVDTDPAVQKNLLAVDVYPWLGSETMTYDTSGSMRGYQAAVFWNENENAPTFNEVYEYNKQQIDMLGDSASIVLAGPFDCSGMKLTGPEPHSLFIYSADTVTTISDFMTKTTWLNDSLLTMDVLNFYGPVGLKE